MQELGLDLKDESLPGTPYSFAKIYVKELFYGLNPSNKPKISTFPNKYGYRKMLIEHDINIDSSCEHHFLPITGYAHIGYIPNEKVIGLSKINRLVDYYSHRPQVQERLCLQILNDLQETLDHKLLAPNNSSSSKEIILENDILIGHRLYFKVNGHSAEGKQSDDGFLLIKGS